MAAKKVLPKTPVMFPPGSFLFQDHRFNQNPGGLVTKVLATLKTLSLFYIESRAFRSADSVGVSSSFYGNKARGYFGLNRKKIHKIGEGISPDERKFPRPAELPANKCIVLSVGRLDRSKNFRIITEILKEMTEDVNWVLIGDGFEARAINREIANKGLQDKFTHLPRVDKLEPYYQHSQILVHPSYYEQFPLVILEAMFFRCVPLVLNPSQKGVFTSNDEMIENGVSGRLLANNPASFIEEISLLQNSNELLEKMGEQALKVVCSRFLFKDYFSRTIKILQDIV